MTTEFPKKIKLRIFWKTHQQSRKPTNILENKQTFSKIHQHTLNILLIYLNTNEMFIKKRTFPEGKEQYRCIERSQRKERDGMFSNVIPNVLKWNIQETTSPAI